MTAALQKKFDEFHEENPRVYELFCETVDELLGRGYTRFSAIAVVTHIVWRLSEETTGELFKVNTAFAAYYARLWTKDHPDKAGFFKLKKLKA